MTGDDLALLMEYEALLDASAGNTGYSRPRGTIRVRFYPGCRRFNWLDERGSVPRRVCVKRLSSWIASK